MLAAEHRKTLALKEIKERLLKAKSKLRRLKDSDLYSPEEVQTQKDYIHRLKLYKIALEN